MKNAYTMIEILVAVTLSLMLLLGVTEMFRNVGTMIDDTTSTQNMTSNMNEVSLVLRNDLGGIDSRLASQPYRMNQPGYTTDASGFLEIIEGMNAPYSVAAGQPFQQFGSGIQHLEGTHVPMSFVAKNPDANTAAMGDQTVGDIDDVLAFTTTANVWAPFRGLINGEPKKSNSAQIIWFVRGTTLYRRVLLIDELNECTTLGNNTQNDVSVWYDSIGTAHRAKPEDLKRRENRFAHPAINGGTVQGPGVEGSPPTNFPMPLYDDSKAAWFLLRMPTLEETIKYPNGFTAAGLPPLGAFNTVQYQGQPLSALATTQPNYRDFWQDPNGFAFNDGTSNWKLDPKTGSLYNETAGDNYNTRHPRAGDDIVLTNVISFDVKVWNPYWVPCQVRGGTATFWAAPQFIDLGQDQLQDINGAWGDVVYNATLNATAAGIPTDKRGYGFTLKGRYNNAATSTNTRRYIDTDLTDGVDDTSDPGGWQRKEMIRTNHATGTNLNYAFLPQTYDHPMLCVFDSWTIDYATDYGYWDPSDDGNPITAAEQENVLNWKAPPPYTENLEAIQITIRCFDPRSRQIKQTQVVHRFTPYEP